MVDIEIRRIGFTNLTIGRTSSLNIIFVHGLMGHPRKTWQIEVKEPSSKPFKSIFKSTSKPKSDTPVSSFWPQHLLAEDLSDAKIWTYGYDADALQGMFTAKNKNSISQHGNDLKVKLERTIQGSIIFIAHSLGGVLVKDVLWQSDFCQKNTKGIIFLGTPHRGSGLGEYAGIASNLAGMALQDINHKLVRSLEVDNQVLNIINREFIKTITRLRIPVHSFQEGKPISGVKGLHDKVVPDYSSVLDIDPSLETKETINHDHRQMVKCKDRSDERYDAIFGVAKQYASRTDVSLAGGALSTSNTNTSRTDTLVASGALSIVNTDAPLAEVTFGRLAESHYTIPYVNRQFTGRRKQVEELQDRVLSQDDFQEFAICGLGGIGKTEIALAFCHLMKTQYPEYSIFWVSALSRSSFEKDYAEIARKCAISIADKKQMLQTVQQYLESSAAGPWIMIVDNADSKELMLNPEQGLKMYLPEHQKGIRVYTTRDEGLAHDITLAINTMVVEEMEYKDAQALLEKYLGNRDMLHDKTATTELLEELEFIPLAIVQAASFMKKTYITIPHYLDLMRGTDKNRVKMLSEENRKAARLGSSDAIFVTWLISFDRIREEEASALKLLYFLAVIQNKDIPYSMLPQESEVDLTRAVGVLRNYSFLVKQDKADAYDMHRLVHQAIRTWMQDSLVIDRLGEWQVAHLANIWPSTEIKNELLWQKYLPHAITAISVSAEAPTELRATLCLLAGRCLRNDGRIQEAVDLLTDCYVWRTEQLDSNDEASLEAQRELAIAYRWSGHEAEAIQILSQLAQKEQSLPDLEDASRMQTLYELGIAQLWVGNSGAAVASLKKVVNNLGRTAPGNNEELLQALHGLVLAYRSNDQPEEASELLMQNPGIERKLQHESVGGMQNDSSSHRINTLEKDLIVQLDLVGKLDLIENKILRQKEDLELCCALAKVILSDLQSQAPFKSQLINIAITSIKNFWHVPKDSDQSDITTRRREATIRVANVSKFMDSKTKKQHSQGGHKQMSVDNQEIVVATAMSSLSDLTDLAALILAEQYSIDKKNTQSQYLSVGSEIWGINPTPQYRSALTSESLDLCMKVMKTCWVNIVEGCQNLRRQSSVGDLKMMHNQDITIRVGFDYVFSKIPDTRKSGKGDKLLDVQWKMSLALEYWQQGYSEAAILHMQAALRIANHLGKPDPYYKDCLRWLDRFETEKPIPEGF